MDELLNLRIADVVTVRAIVALLVVVAALRFLWRLLRPPAAEAAHFVPLACGTCGWRGKTSTYARKCPKCGGPLFPER